MATDSGKRHLSGGFSMPTADEQPISDEQFLRCYLTFGALIRWRSARALLDTAIIHKENEHLRMALATGIWQQLGLQIEDLVVFLIAIEKWVRKEKQPFLADLFSDTFVKSQGETSPRAVGERLKELSDDSFLSLLGLPTSPSEWSNTTVFHLARESRNVLAGILYNPDIIRSVTNKVKHGPQLVLQTLKEIEPSWSGPEAVYVRLLFNGARVAQKRVDDPNPTHLYLFDEIEYLARAVQQIEATARQLCSLAGLVYSFTFKRDVDWTPHPSWLSKGVCPIIW